MRQWFILPLIALACAYLAAPESRAQIPGQENPFKRSERFWKLRDTCARSAQKQFPDHTAEGNSKRERAYQKCLEASNEPYESPAAKETTGSSH